ncbi:hypothetical protein [Dechloromonas sp. A34]|uniref:hypothetical protein n=1 Tax=Dechloromonas sp. A34 TaxID=447588 RepID=UPI002249A18A|nr:hypothetical protein [Dechloromonas sp. A34]
MLKSIVGFIRGFPENANLRLLLSESRKELGEAKTKIKALESDITQRNEKIEELTNDVNKLKRLIDGAKNRPAFAITDENPLG